MPGGSYTAQKQPLHNARANGLPIPTAGRAYRKNHKIQFAEILLKRRIFPLAKAPAQKPPDRDGNPAPLVGLANSGGRGGLAKPGAPYPFPRLRRPRCANIHLSHQGKPRNLPNREENFSPPAQIRAKQDIGLAPAPAISS